MHLFKTGVVVFQLIRRKNMFDHNTGGAATIIWRRAKTHRLAFQRGVRLDLADCLKDVAGNVV